MGVNQGYQHDDLRIIDYGLSQLPGTDLLVRGPVPDLNKPYIVALGAAQTFGRFVHRPYSDLVAEQTGLPVLNLGMSGAGPSFFLLRPNVISIINRATLAIVQVMSGRSSSNSRVTVSVNQGVVRPVDAPATVHGEFAETAYVRLLRTESPHALASLRAEIRARAIAEMRALLDRITVPRVMLWFSTREPNYTENLREIAGYWGDFPHFLNQGVLLALEPYCEMTAVAVSKEGLPQPLFDRHTGEPVELWKADKFPRVQFRCHNRYYPSPEMHVAAAQALAAPVASLLEGRAHVGALPPVRRPQVKQREVLVHIHIFKNAGTSLDALLRQSFGRSFKEFDPAHEDEVLCEEQLLEILRSEPDIRCIASHQIRQPLVGDSMIKIVPYFLLRHPIDRIKSVYSYERRPDRQQTFQNGVTEMASRMDFKHFVQNLLMFPKTKRLVSNFQTGVLGRLGNLAEQRHDKMWEWKQPVREEHLLEALKFMDSVPAVGVVERFDESLAALRAAHTLRFPQLLSKGIVVNRTRPAKPLEQKLAEIRDEVGASFYENLLQENAMDLALWDAANRRLS
jgi:hypothetical protein